MNFIKRTGLFVFVVLFFSAVYSQNKPNTLLWKVSKDGDTNVSYLFGTFHQVNPDFFDSLSVANKYLKESKILFVESYNSAKDNDNINAVAKNEVVKFEEWNKAKWKANLNVKQFSVFEKFTKSKWVDEYIYTVDPTQLMFLLQYMYLQGVCDTVNRKSHEPMDTRITNIGLANKLTVVGLDENQMQDIKTASEKDKAFGLKNLLKLNVTFINYILNKSTDNPIAKMLFDYRNKNLNYFLNKKIASSYLLNERNNKWMLGLTEKFESNNCFVAVGFRHLFYKTGLIQQLRNKGFKVEPVEM
jgi:uncharacterized protein YbaP (TraB family)